MKISHFLKRNWTYQVISSSHMISKNKPSIMSYAYQELVHASLTLLQVDPFDGNSLLLGGTVGSLDHGSCSTPWKQTHP